MKAAYLDRPLTIAISSVPKPEPLAGELCVRLTATGICGSDVHLFRGHRPLPGPTIIGHEGIGVIAGIGDGVAGRSMGERVAIEPNIPCGTCRHCLRGRGNICPDKRVIGQTEAGCFAEYICLPAAFCHTIPDEVSDADAVTIEPMAVAWHALTVSGAQPGEAIAVIGLGSIGLLLTHLGIALGYTVYVVEVNQAKLAIATRLGAIAVDAEPVPAAGSFELKLYWEAAAVCAVFECAGSDVTASLATASAPRGAAVVLVGLSPMPASFVPLIMAREGISIVPSIIYDHPADFEKVIQLIRTGVIRPGFIVSKYMSLDDLQAALELASRGTETKIVISL
ncbi:MAG TPA: alcohol dehydrogenase catalytic domain-containing protein [Panacibacter sp.]|mgnify:FL=1|nr:alcohol dehydrogenase catalytic domain-containing protein [Panacibacter sp.]HNP45040.1 alcohol dehydrogenase catalytic domain-containing protein [Panacibacter sp.]